MDENNKEDAYWYKFTVEKLRRDKWHNVVGDERLVLTVKLHPEDMYAISKGIVEYAIPEESPDFTLPEAPTE